MRSLHWVTAQAVGQRLIAEYRTNLRDKRIFSVSTKRGLTGDAVSTTAKYSSTSTNNHGINVLKVKVQVRKN